MVAHPRVKRCPAHVPIVEASYTLQDALRALLACSGWERMGYYAWRRGGAAACRAFGAALCSIAAAGRWDSEADADRYASPPLGWKFFLPDDVLLLPTGFICWMTPSTPTKSGRLERWAPRRGQDKRLVPQMSSPATVMTKVPVCAPALTCTSPSYWASVMTSRPTQWLTGPLDSPKVSADEDVGPHPPQLNNQARSPPVVRHDHARAITPAYTRGTQATAARAPDCPRPASGGTPGNSQVRALRPRLE